MDPAAAIRALDRVRRRHVFYVCGFDPQGATGYYRLFKRELERFEQYGTERETATEHHVLLVSNVA